MLRVGVQLPEVERHVTWPEYRAMATAAEEVGFDSIWIGDHLLYRPGARGAETGPWDAWTLLAALAAATERVALGPLVACTAFHPPGVLARMAANLAEVSGGRFVLGLGAGWNADEFAAFGLPFDRPVSRFEEAFDLVRRLLAGERVTVEGRYVQAHDAVLLPRPAEPPPMMIGSNGPRMLRIALPHVQAWNTWYEDYGNRPERFAALNARISEAAQAAGRDPGEIRRSACVLVALGRDAGERAITAEAPPVEGPPEAIAAALRAMADAGADEVILVLTPVTEASIRALAPALEALRAS
ncbi:MAG TPA: LLM class flavin-dependent oxidoreductase [Baekduia sp.]|nr:LLM class flavin-dependent oxidoreductase [Baekduia sp.]